MMQRQRDSRVSATHRPSRWRLGIAITALALGSACGGGGSFDEPAGDDASAKAEGGTLTVAQSSDILTMDPAMHRARITQTVIRNVSEALVNQDDSLQPVPELATSWDQVDATTWRFELRTDVTFHNGEKFDAEAVKYSIERILDPEQASPRASMLSMIDSVTAEDPDTVVIKTNGPSPTLLASLSVNEIVPPKYVEEVGDDGFAKKPVGTGPFTFGEWVPNERVVLEANDEYWDGRPNIDTLVFRPIPEVSARMAALQSDEVQIAAEIPPDLAKSLEGDVRAESIEGTRIFFLAMNVTKAPFNQPDVRVAANQAIDRETLVTSLYQGFGRTLNQPAFPEMLGYSEDFKGPDHDPAAATPVLSAAAGPVRIDVEEKDKTLAQAVAGQLQESGLEATVNVLETEAFTDSIENGSSAAYLSSWGVAEGDADVIFARHFWSPVRAEAFYTGYENSKLDALIERGRSTSDESERDTIYADAIEIVMQDAPWAPIINPDEIYGVHSTVHGWEPSPIGRINVVEATLDR